MAAEEGVGRSELEALAATRRELGPDYEAPLLDAFAERVQHTIEERVRSTQGSSEVERRERYALARRHGALQFALAFLSVAACIPLAIVLALNDQLPALLIAILGIAAVNASYASVGPPRGQ